MATATALSAPAAPLRPAPAAGLRAWRLAQRLTDPATRRVRAWTIADAARRYSAFIGREVHFVTWKGWELAPGQPGAPDGRIPNRDDMRGLIAFTGGAVRADHFYGIGTAGTDGADGTNGTGRPGGET